MTVVLALSALLAALLELRRSPQTRSVRATFTRLTTMAGPEEAPAVSPDGKLVAYVSYASGNGDIYLQRIGGRRAVNLTADSKDADHMPNFSPDGQLIAFRSERDAGGIFVMGATGESIRRVSDFGYNPVWSPDGKELAVSSQPMISPYVGTAPSGEVWRVELASGRRRRVHGADAFAPAWSPRGKRIAFCRSHRGDILTVPATGGEATAVTSGAPRDWSPIWSADGHIYFSSDRGGSMNLWRVPVDEATGKATGEPEPLSTPALFSGPLTISGDGKRIVYCARNPQSSLQRIAFDPAKEAIVGETVEFPLGNTFTAMPDISPDGQWVVFNTLFEQEDIYVMRSDGRDLRKLTDDRYTDTWPRWSPDGKRIAFASNRPGVISRTAGSGFQIWAINADGSGLEQLTDLDPAAGGPPVWSPDGRRLAIRSERCKEPCFVDISGTLPAKTAEVIPLPLTERGYQGPVLRWSPDGKWLLGIAWRRDKVTELRAFVYSVDTRTFRMSPEALRGPSAGARWLSDSRRIVMLDGNKLYVVDRDTLKGHEIHTFAFPAAELALSNDDRAIYFVRTSDEADVWLAELQ